jgi:hypothetical protein
LGRARRLWRPSIAGGGGGARGERGRRGLGGERSHADFSHIGRGNSGFFTDIVREGDEPADFLDVRKKIAGFF